MDNRDKLNASYYKVIDSMNIKWHMEEIDYINSSISHRGFN